MRPRDNDSLIRVASSKIFQPKFLANVVRQEKLGYNFSLILYNTITPNYTGKNKKKKNTAKVCSTGRRGIITNLVGIIVYYLEYIRI